MNFLAVLTASFRVVLRGRYLYLAAAIIGVVAAATMMSAGFSGRQPATVALDVGISAFRLCIPVFAAVLAQGLVSYEFERKYFLSSLTYPHSRTVWLLGRYLAIILVLAATLLICALVLRELVVVAGGGYRQGTGVALGSAYWIVILFALVDLYVIASFAVLIAVFAKSPGLVLFGTFGFMLIARSYASIYALVDGESGLVPHEKTYRDGLATLHYVFPDLGALDVRAIALYGRIDFLPPIWPQQMAASILYALGMIALATWLFQRKRFD